jgi:hypothetical protein
VVEEIGTLVRKYNVNLIVFEDSNFFVNLRRVEEICVEIIRKGLNIKWVAECRADYFPRFTEGFLDLLAKSGLSGLTIGAESGSKRILDMFRKDITVGEIVLSARMLSKYDIQPGYGFIVGTFWEREEDVIASIRLANKLRRLCPRARYAFSILTPYPKSEIADELIKAGFLKEPETLREFTTDTVRRSYTGFTGPHAGKPWNRNPDFLERLSYFSELAYNTYSDSQIRDYIRHFDVKFFPDLCFVLIARLRMRFIFFGLPVDQFLYSKFREMRRTALEHKRRIGSWVRKVSGGKATGTRKTML